MFRLASLFLFLVFSSSVVLAQNCFPNDLMITTQADLNFFASNYSSCTVIDGSLIIDGTTITDLSALANITLVNGDLEIEDTALIDLNGLDNLVQVKGGVKIRRNDLLTSLNGLGALVSTGTADWNEFFLGDNDSLVNLLGLNSLTTVVGSLNISYSSLLYLNGLTSLTSISEDFVIDTNFDLISLAGLFNLQSIGGELRVRDNEALQILYGLNGLQSATDVSIDSNPKLTNLNALSNLSSSLRILEVTDNDALTSLNGLNNIPAITNTLRVRYNDVLNDISAIDNFDFLNINTFYLNNNPLLDICNYPSVCFAIYAANNVNVNSNGLNCSGQLQLGAQCAGQNICIFVAPTGDWNVPSNWSGNTLPDQNCDVYILNNRVCNISPGTSGVCNTLCVSPGAAINMDSTSDILVLGN